MRNPEGVTLIEFVRGCVLTNITPSGFVHSLFPFFYINVTPIGVLRQLVVHGIISSYIKDAEAQRRSPVLIKEITLYKSRRLR